MTRQHFIAPAVFEQLHAAIARAAAQHGDDERTARVSQVAAQVEAALSEARARPKAVVAPGSRMSKALPVPPELP